MTPLEIAALVALIVVATLASYIQRVYSEYGKILSREVQENLDAWEVRIEPHLGLSRISAEAALSRRDRPWVGRAAFHSPHAPWAAHNS
jgi:hypothetical protein